MENEKEIYDFQLDEIAGGVIDFSNYRDKNILIVNTASACGYTYQYEQLQALHDEFESDLVVVGVPSNDFGRQELGSDEEVKEFCSSKFNVSFPLSKKINVAGPDKHPVFKWLIDHSPNEGSEIEWNFNKFFINKKGEVKAQFASSVDPYSDEVIDLISSN